MDQLSTYIDTIMASSGDLSKREATLGDQLTDFEIELEDEDGELIVEEMMEEAPYNHYDNLMIIIL